MPIQKIFFISLRMLLLSTFFFGLLYPLACQWAGQLLFEDKSEKALLTKGAHVQGSLWIGQEFRSPKYFWGRPGTGASNLSGTSEKLKDEVQKRRRSFSRHHGISQEQVPLEMIYASGSGLDPHISPEAANFQVARVASFRNMQGNQRDQLKELVAKNTEEKELGIFGRRRVNVLKLNREVDELFY